MAKQRIYELARALDLESKDVLARAQELGFEVKTASSGLEEDEAALVAKSLADAASEADTTPDTDADVAGDVADLEEAPADGGESGDEEAEEEFEEGAPDDSSVLLVEPGITTHELARMIKTRTADIVKELMEMGEMVPAGGEIPLDAISPLGHRLGFE